MPEVPTIDPFKTKVPGKAQDRLPQGNAQLPNLRQPSMAEILMAAATLHEQGRLFATQQPTEVADARNK